MIRTEAIGRAVALLTVALAVTAQSAMVGSVANGDTSRTGFVLPGLATTQQFGVRLLDGALTVPDLGGHTATVGSNDKPAHRFTVADISMDGELERQVGEARYNWPQDLDSNGAPIELRREHVAPLVLLSF